MKQAVLCAISFFYIPIIFTMEITMKSQPHSIMYAPWRESYSNTINNPDLVETPAKKECIFCHITHNFKDTNEEHLVLYRAQHSFIMLSKYPYVSNGIHFLIVPYEHTRETSDLLSKTYDEANILTQKLCTLFSRDCHEIFVTTNQGTSAGASIPDHHHRHVIINKSPRYYNLIDAMQNTKPTIDLLSLFDALKPQLTKLDTVTVPTISLPPSSSNCYYCAIRKERNNDKKNLVIHRGKHVLIMLSHHPTYLGEVEIIPHEHIESLEIMSPDVYKEINHLTAEFYPILLSLLHTTDSNIGLISYGEQATNREHIRQKIIPRKNTWNTTSTTRAYHLNGDVINLYNKLLFLWHKKCRNNSKL